MNCIVVFLGSEVAGDDSAGYEIYMRIKDKIKARLEYLGTDFFKFYGIYRGEEKLVIVDAVYGIDDVIHLKNNEIFEIEDKSQGIHFLSAIEALKIMREVMENFPKEIHLVGIPARSFEEKTLDEKTIKKAIEMIEEVVLRDC
ncbi:MAG TPA: hydrogenase maturation protease [Thermoplasmatales archaeon]|nr:hydrogenase maturation protease [Thermoplasmatales archaeon]